MMAKKPFLTQAQMDEIFEKIRTEHGYAEYDHVVEICNQLVRTSNTHQRFLIRRDELLRSYLPYNLATQRNLK